MRIEEPKCPKCGQPAVGTLESLNAIAELGYIRADGTCEHNGYTRHLEETQHTVHVMDKIVLVCAQHHDWTSVVHTT